jgi:translation initiation factor 1
MSSNSRLVYSTETGRIKTPENDSTSAPPGDGVVRVSRQSKGRGGKTVTVIDGLPADQLKTICKKLKSLCAGGGAVKEFSVEIQGDHQDKIIDHLRKQNFQVKAAGG